MQQAIRQLQAEWLVCVWAGWGAFFWGAVRDYRIIFAKFAVISIYTTWKNI